MSSNLYSFRVSTTHLAGKARTLAGFFDQGNQAIEAANRSSVEWLGERAATIITKQVRRAHDTRNEVTLAAMVQKPEASVVTTDGFRFLDAAQVAALGLRASKYYRAIEFGSQYWVERTASEPFGLFFFGAGGVGRQQGRGSPSKKFPQVRITNPVPTFAYASTASDSFVKGRQWYKFAYAELARRGMGFVKIGHS